MAINFDSFQEGTTSTIQSNDYVVGFDTAVPGGERKWTVSTLANAVSGEMDPQLNNLLNNNFSSFNSEIQTISQNITNSFGIAKAFVNFNANASTLSVNYFTPGTYSWTAPAGVTSVNITLVAGGGGGNASEPFIGGGGGGGGEVITNSTLSVTPGATYAIVVGAGGVSGTIAGMGVTPATGGGNSQFGSTIARGGGPAGDCSPVAGNQLRNQDGGYSGSQQTCVEGDPAGESGGGSQGGKGGSSYGSGGIGGSVLSGSLNGSSAAANSGGGGGGGARNSFGQQRGLGGFGGSGRVMFSYLFSGGVTLNDAFNVDSVTRNSQGIYTINFTPGTFNNADYTYLGSARDSNAIGDLATVGTNSGGTKTSTALQVVTKEGTALFDCAEVCVACFDRE
jgi:hypothetical protein